MAKISTSISVDADIKMKAQELFADFGLDLSTAVNIFLCQAVRENAIPFAIRRKVPNEETVAAMMEAEEMVRDPERYKRYASFSRLLRDTEENASE